MSPRQRPAYEAFFLIGMIIAVAVIVFVVVAIAVLGLTG